MLSFLEKDQVPGTRCRKCKTSYFPPRADCQKCRSNAMDWVPMDRNCTLLSFTEVHFAPPQFQNEAPYLLGLAELGDGSRAFAPIDGAVDRRILRPGIRMFLRVVKRDGDGLYYQLQM